MVWHPVHWSQSLKIVPLLLFIQSKSILSWESILNQIGTPRIVTKTSPEFATPNTHVLQYAKAVTVLLVEGSVPCLRSVWWELCKKEILQIQISQQDFPSWSGEFKTNNAVLISPLSQLPGLSNTLVPERNGLGFGEINLLDFLNTKQFQ